MRRFGRRREDGGSELLHALEEQMALVRAAVEGLFVVNVGTNNRPLPPGEPHARKKRIFMSFTISLHNN